MNSDSRIFLEELLSTASPSGFEKAGQNVWTSFTSSYADVVQMDAYGSASAHIQTNSSACTVMLEAHCDEIGMIIHYIDEKGFIYVQKIGGSDSAIAQGRKVHILTQKGTVSGVTGSTAIHLKEKNGKLPKWKDIFIDIGAENKEEALQMVQLGDPVVFSEQHEFISDEIITGRALDNRLGSYIIAKTLQKLWNQKSRLGVNVIALNAVQEEIGGFGAKMMAFRHTPDVALVTDVTHATDSPGIDPKEHGFILLGKGPVVCHGGSNHPLVQQHVREVAEQMNMPLQHEAAGSRTGTDTDSIFHQKQGIPSGLVSLPLRYMHSPVELASLSDVEMLTDLFTECVLSLKPDQRFSAGEM
ncbi:M20/M25/M40 family metallo-hydrolase [Balneolaceae bacterium ANBcel3]|nr:M20/M25/M40 family metallo-hydrolase [Balneolaceae bacterium ANBcel3]